jgi:hypothetical protein
MIHNNWNNEKNLPHLVTSLFSESTLWADESSCICGNGFGGGSRDFARGEFTSFGLVCGGGEGYEVRTEGGGRENYIHWGRFWGEREELGCIFPRDRDWGGANLENEGECSVRGSSGYG